MLTTVTRHIPQTTCTASSPNAISAWHELRRCRGAKNDADDARVIARVPATAIARAAGRNPYSSETKALRTVVRTRDDLVTMRVAATNRLTVLLDARIGRGHGSVRRPGKPYRVWSSVIETEAGARLPG